MDNFIALKFMGDSDRISIKLNKLGYILEPMNNILKRRGIVKIRK